MKQNNLSANLKKYQNHRNLSLGEFANELDIPKSTLRKIINDGNATLATILQISDALEISLDMLVFDKHVSDKLFILNNMETLDNWMSLFPPEKREKIADLISQIWDVIGE